MLSLRRQRFAEEYAVDGNGAEACKRAGYSEIGAGQRAHELLKNDEVRKAIEVQKARLAQLAGLTPTRLLQELTAVALGDPRRITHLRVGCCRYCWGIDNKWQWTRSEYEEAVEDAMSNADPEKGPKMPALRGGVGFEMNREPNRDCPRCGGLGESHQWVADMRSLDAATARMIESVETTKDGHKIKLKNPTPYLEMLMKYMGMLVERKEVDMKVGVERPVSELSDEELMQLAAGGATVLEAEN